MLPAVRNMLGNMLEISDLVLGTIDLGFVSLFLALELSTVGLDFTSIFVDFAVVNLQFSPLRLTIMNLQFFSNILALEFKKQWALGYVGLSFHLSGSYAIPTAFFTTLSIQ